MLDGALIEWREREIAVVKGKIQQFVHARAN